MVFCKGNFHRARNELRINVITLSFCGGFSFFGFCPGVVLIAFTGLIHFFPMTACRIYSFVIFIYQNKKWANGWVNKLVQERQKSKML